MAKIIAALDIGTTKVAGIIGEWTQEGVRIIGHGLAPSTGMRKGVVVNIEATFRGIEESLRMAFELAKTERYDLLFTGIAGKHVKCINSRGVIPIQNREVSMRDIDGAIEAACTIHVPEDREIIHRIPQEYFVDGQDGIQDPMGMVGVRLEVDTHIVTVSATSRRNIQNCVNRAGYELSQVVLEPLASAEAILADDERRLGVVVLDIGGGTTDISVFRRGNIQHSSILELGGDSITNDISIGLHTSIAEAERLKIKYGSAIPEMLDEDEEIEIPTVSGDETRIINVGLIGEIVQPRIFEILKFARERLEETELQDLLSGGVVITGGTALLDRIAPFAEQIFGMPARIGVPKVFCDDWAELKTPIYSTAIGLVRFGDIFLHMGLAPGWSPGNEGMRSGLRRLYYWLKRNF